MGDPRFNAVSMTNELHIIPASPSGDIFQQIEWRRVQRLRCLYHLYRLSLETRVWSIDWRDISEAMRIEEDELEIAVKFLAEFDYARVDEDHWLITLTALGAMELETILIDEVEKSWNQRAFPGPQVLWPEITPIEGSEVPPLEN